jgi:putative hydrolase of the HAD superfamily
MVTVFDLDDTLYDELSYVRSGFRAVATWGAEHLGLDATTSYATLIRLLETEGRGKIFNHWLQRKGAVNDALRVYRHHTPDIILWKSGVQALDVLKDQPMYLVTDGHKAVQAKKIEALGIAPRFRHVYITHRYGIVHAKPSPYCFSLIRKRERCEWNEVIYVADNPSKDFVNLNTLGVHTIRVLTGQHRSVVAQLGFDARHHIDSLDDLPHLLTSLAA